MKLNKYKGEFSRLAGIGLPIPKNLARTNGGYIPYTGSGIAIKTPNTYPQTLADIAANSPTHGGALMKKAKMIYGKGINFDLLPQDLVDFFLNCNDKNESINDILNKVSNDYPTYAGFYIKVRWNYDRTINSMEHVPTKYVRLGIPEDGEITYYVVSNDWEMKMDKNLRYEYKINRFDPDKITIPKKIVKGVPVDVNQETLDNAVQLIYFKAYSTSDDGYYPIPDYVSCLDAAFTEETVGIAMKNQISNGINGAYIISAQDTVLDDESKQAITNEIAEFTSGPENTGGIMFLPSNVKVDKLEALPADTYTELNKEVRQRIITAHNIPAILLEYSQSGGFNNRADEMIAAWTQFQESMIKNYQIAIIRVFNLIADYVTQEPYDIQIIPFFEINQQTQVQDTSSNN